MLWLQLKGFSSDGRRRIPLLFLPSAHGYLWRGPRHPVWLNTSKRVLPVRKQVLHHSPGTAVKMCDTSRRELRWFWSVFEDAPRFRLLQHSYSSAWSVALCPEFDTAGTSLVSPHWEPLWRSDIKAKRLDGSYTGLSIWRTGLMSRWFLCRNLTEILKRTLSLNVTTKTTKQTSMNLAWRTALSPEYRPHSVLVWTWINYIA